MPISFRASFYSLFCFFQTLLFNYVYWIMLLSGGLTTDLHIYIYNNETNIQFVFKITKHFGDKKITLRICL